MSMHPKAHQLVSLSGVLSIATIVRQHTLLAGHLSTAAVFSGDDVIPSLGIDLSGVEEIDACGCQLLLSFLRRLRQDGMGLPDVSIPPHLAESIRVLGFEEELNAMMGQAEVNP